MMPHVLKWVVFFVSCTVAGQVLAQDSRRPATPTTNYKPIYTPSHPSQALSLQGGYNNRPPANRPPPPNPYPPQGAYPPPRPGVNITYQAPSYSNYNHQTYTWVNGDPNTAQIQSSRYVMITDWQRLGLPAPPTGMYWVFEDGRYALVPNHK